MQPTIEYTNENTTTVRLTGEPPFILKRLTDMGVSGNSQTVRSPGQDGENAYGLTRSAREINITGHVYVHGNADYPVQAALEDAKDLVSQAFDPKYFGTLIYITEGGRWKIRCRPVASPAFGEPVNGNYCTVDIDLRSEKWCWTTAEPETAELGKIEPNWVFPYSMPNDFAFVYPDATYYNPTPYDIPPVITAYNSGDAVEITNTTTGQALRFTHAVGAYEKLIVDCDELTAILYEKSGDDWVYKANVMSWLTLDSDITKFKAVPGNNNFTLTNHTPTSEPVLTVEFHRPKARVY